jgi:TonB family protein
MAPTSVTLSFALHAEGRPFDIAGEIEPRARFYTRDLMPALRATRFAAGTGLTGCSITYTPVLQKIAELPLETLGRFGVAQRARIDAAAWDRIAPGNCRERPRVAPLLRAYPDWRKLDRRAGEWGWTYVGYDIDADGNPINIATLMSSGDAAFDAEGRAVAEQGRFAGGPRTGCVQVWWRAPETIPAPPIPSRDETKGNPACEIDDRWAREPRLTYPKPYQNRAVEGWAILRFDVAPWGEIGSIEVLDAQPSSEIGDAATAVLRAARFKPQEGGLTGCIDRVIFRIRSDEARDTREDDTGEPG